ncbi:two-component sensor histidine kinase [Microbulbifer sp. A4B17]|uniref:ATP-binding protein n=1 Tax=Microbulbifer sp. A4B17 TaxID=359370 RepID=UPI000D52EB56|nr:ATP-binding protein [Microbulbifer sp. A4B17]AWF79893.1 two-component sensor histidine kinase [Microbulbifer sp. A4B17]
MSLNIRYKLSLAFLLTTAITVGGMFVFFQWSFDQGFMNYIQSQELREVDDLVEELQDIYASEGSWKSMRGNSMRWQRMHRRVMPSYFENLPPPPFPPPGMRGPRHPPEHPPEHSVGKSLIGRLVLLDKEKRSVIGYYSGSENIAMQPLVVNGETVGYLAINPLPVLDDDLAVGFVKEQSRTFALISIATFILALAIALPLAWQLVRPIRKLTEATSQLTSGNFKTRIDIEQRDELGQLSADFNRLAATLEANEHARNRWMADISHELRTPLAVLKGQIEAIQDGVRSASPENLRILHSKIQQLSRLIDDLYELSLSDAGALSYCKSDISLVKVLRGVIEDFEIPFDQKNIHLSSDLQLSEDKLVYADEARLNQLFSNLLTNSLRYTDSDGQLKIAARCEARTAIITLADSAPGVASADIPHLFERLYRADSSRSRETGGAGLGLSICQNIVTAHEGSISATPSTMGGLEISIFLPLSQRIKW